MYTLSNIILGNKLEINKCLRLQIINRSDDLLSAGSTCVLGMRSLVGEDWLLTTGLATYLALNL